MQSRTAANKPPLPLKDAGTDPQVKARITEVEKIAKENATIIIGNDEEYQNAGLVLNDVKRRAKELETLRKSFTDPLNTAKNNIIAFFKAPIDKLGAVEKSVSKAMSTYYDAKQKRIAEERAKAEAAAAKEREKLEARAAKAEASGKDDRAEELRTKAMTVQTAAPVTAAPISTGVTPRENWTSEVTSLKELVEAVASGKAPLEAIEANTTYLNKMAREKKGAASMPGVRFYSQNSFASRG